MLSKFHYVPKNNYDELCNMVYCFEENDVISPSNRKVGEIMKRNCEKSSTQSRRSSSRSTRKAKSRSSK